MRLSSLLELVRRIAIAVPLKRPLFGAVTLLAPAIVALMMALTAGPFSSSAVQNPSMSIDMVTDGNTYVPSVDQDANGFPDPGTNHMTIGTIDSCLTTAAPGNAASHNHTVHLLIRNVEDLVGWQVRFNYIGDQMRPASFDATPFTDTGGQRVGFANLPIDAGVHRDVIPASNIPAAPGDGAMTPQSALVGAVYNGAQTFAV
jgi:hypothetical protein